VHPLIRLRAVAGIGPVMVIENPSLFGNTTTAGMGMPDLGTFGDSTGGGGGMMGMSSGTSIPAGAKVETKHWVLLTGLIPYEDQLKEYISRFANALNSSPNDYPVYFAINVERNEIGVNHPDGTPVWVPVNVDAQFNSQKRWAGTSPDPVDLQSYALPPRAHYTASPLPPLSNNRQFGAEVAYPPYIPLLADSLKLQMIEQQKIQRFLIENRRDAELDDYLKDDSMFPGMTGIGTGGGMGGNTGASQLSGMFNSAGGDGGMAGPGRGGMGGGMGGGYGDPMGGGMDSMGITGMGGNAANNQWIIYTKTPPTIMIEAKYRLFRYFDFSVKPGKSYKYRVKLAVYNPNFRLTDRFLDNDAVKTKLSMPVWSDFSSPSGPVAVNSNARIIAKSVGNIPRNTWQPQNATVSSIVFDTSDNEDYIAKDKAVTQGMVLNFVRQGGERVSSLTSTSGMYGMPGGSTSMGSTSPGMPGAPTGRGAQPQAKAATKTLDHISGECVLDVTGKRKLIGTNNEHTPAGQVMFMAFDGTIQIQSIKTNKLELDRYEKPVTQSTGMGSGMMIP